MIGNILAYFITMYIDISQLYECAKVRPSSSMALEYYDIFSYGLLR